MGEQPNRWVAESAEYRPDRYYTYPLLTELLTNWARQYPHLMTLESIGKTREGRDIWCATLTNSETGHPADKPATFVDANIHAGEVTGCATVLWLLNHLLTTYGDDAQTTRLLDAMTLYAVPAIMLDGMDLYLTSAERLRSSVRLYPYEDQREGMRREDLDGDGLILQMRVKDPNGAWKQHPDDPRLMIRRGPDEFEGEFYSVYEEGSLHDWDGGAITLAPEHYGLDLNRAFPFEWAPEDQQRGAGNLPLEEPEPRALAEFIVAHPNICTTQHFHTWSGVILRPSSSKTDDDLPSFDLKVYKAIGQMGVEETGYPCISIHDDYAYDKKAHIHGAVLDWIYQGLGRFAYSTELWSLPAAAGVAPDDLIQWMQMHDAADDLAMARYLDERVDGAGLYPWKAFDHPQLGSVEIGGWDYKFAIQNPPGSILEETSAGNARFVLREMATNPCIEFTDVSVENLGHELWKVSAIIQNTGFLPTYISEVGKKLSLIHGPKVTIDGVEIVTGKREIDLGHLEGRANQFGSISIPSRYANLTRGKAEWVVRATAGTTITLTAASTRAGRKTETRTLE